LSHHDLRVNESAQLAMMLRSDQSIILKADVRLPPELPEPPLPPIERLAQISDAEAVADMLPDTNYIGALTKLKGYDDACLFVARLIDPRVLEQVRLTESSIRGHANLEARRIDVQFASVLMYAMFAFAVLLRGVRIGFGLANGSAPAEIA
jgi:two-component system, NtrC family, nitrogen regulation sensor histidine kinase NtrY